MKKFRKYVFAVVYFKGRKPEFLIFHRIKNWRGWEFLKGGLKERESEDECLKREIAEETGAKRYKILARTKHLIKYKWPKSFIKDNHKFQGANGRLFVVKLFDKKVRIDRTEHDRFKWVGARDAFKYLTYENQRNALKYVLRNHKLS
jgi:8-oxo-dGTP pyrophosphatase MutT (NUDIX family)